MSPRHSIRVIRGVGAPRGRRGGCLIRAALRLRARPALVEVDEFAVEAELVEVAAGRLDPPGFGHAARLYRIEFLRTLTGPIVLVGHSYGGNVISVAAAGEHSAAAGLVRFDASTAAPSVLAPLTTRAGETRSATTSLEVRPLRSLRPLRDARGLPTACSSASYAVRGEDFLQLRAELRRLFRPEAAS